MPTTPFDTRWFTQRVVPDSGYGYELQMRERHGNRPAPLARSRGGAIWMYAAVTLWVVLAVLVVLWSVAWMPVTSRQLDEPLERLLFGLILVAPYTIAYAGLAAWLTWVFFGYHGPERYERFRLHSFADENGVEYEPFVRIDDSHQVTDLVRLDRGREVEIGNLHAVIPGTKSGATTFLYSYIAFRLAVPLPHIVLDARANQLQMAIGADVLNNQRLSLEGDFDRYFTLYCPAGYERDALYLFTPDVMVSFIDGARTLEAEIRGDVLVLSCAESISEPETRSWQRIATALDALIPQLEDWERWRDAPREERERHAAVELPANAPLIQRALAQPSIAPLRRRKSRFALVVWLTIIAYVGTVCVLAMVLS